MAIGPRSLVLIGLLGLVPALPALAQPAPSIKRTPLQNFDVPGPNYQTVIGTAEIAGGASIGKHTHFGVEAGYVLEGEFVMMVDGQPPKTYRKGESYLIPAGAPHDAKAHEAGAKVLATYVVEKGKPLATPAP